MTKNSPSFLSPNSSDRRWSVDLINQSRWPLTKLEVTSWVAQIKKILFSLATKDKQLLKKLKTFSKLENELTIVLLSEKQMQRINKEFRQKDKATDVLSFSSEQNLGELLFCPQVIKRQAPLFNHTSKQEFRFMLVHGILHLIGYDHEQDHRSAKIMFNIQDQIYKQIKVK